MLTKILPPDLQKMSIAERILLAEDLWDSVVVNQEALKITPAQRDALDHRLQNHQASPDAGTSWDEVKGRITTK